MHTKEVSKCTITFEWSIFSSKFTNINVVVVYYVFYALYVINCTTVMYGMC